MDSGAPICKLQSSSAGFTAFLENPACESHDLSAAHFKLKWQLPSAKGYLVKCSGQAIEKMQVKWISQGTYFSLVAKTVRSSRVKTALRGA